MSSRQPLKRNEKCVNERGGVVDIKPSLPRRGFAIKGILYSTGLDFLMCFNSVVAKFSRPNVSTANL
ncbi:hypothetical protein J6590_095325 [Homalodisca vitripennis]|nr:hypothetical protein J6590_100153 [Homalodisca vitripennis]KAG8324307.1 hypothetical protein J6590_095325 [Homalodisca vitripennis]